MASRLSGRRLCALLLPAIAALSPAAEGQTPPVTVISSSPLYVTPETVSPAPTGFGSFGGDYFIPDDNAGRPNGNIWVVPPGGGAPTSFSTVPIGSARGGVFLPSTGWGANSGNFVTAGPTLVGGVETGTSQVITYGPTGASSLFVQTTASFAQPVIAPAGFGGLGGQLIVANAVFTNPNILAISPSGSISVVASTPISPFGLAFAPSGFGAFSGDLFASSARDGQIIVVAPDGTVTPFANLPLTAGQPSLFQMAFSPAGFLPGQGPLLFVSVRGSTTGGGTLGNVDVLNSSGQLIADLRTDLGLTKFDPRGLYFPNNQTLIVSDTSDPILAVSSSAFASVPEPSSSLLVGVGALGLAALARRRMLSR